jgi:hypothetical protein
MPSADAINSLLSWYQYTDAFDLLMLSVRLSFRRCYQLADAICSCSYLFAIYLLTVSVCDAFCLLILSVRYCYQSAGSVCSLIQSTRWCCLFDLTLSICCRFLFADTISSSIISPMLSISWCLSLMLSIRCCPGINSLMLSIYWCYQFVYHFADAIN